MKSSSPCSGARIRATFSALLLATLFVLSSCSKKSDDINTLREQVWKNPKDAALQVRLGNAYVHDKRFAEADEAYRTALAIDPELDDASHALGALAFNRKNYPEALLFFSKHLEHAPKDSLRLYDIGNVYMQLNELDKAANYYRQSIDNSTAFVEAHYNLAVCCARTGKLAEARSIYDWLLLKNNYLAVSLQRHLNKEIPGK